MIVHRRMPAVAEIVSHLIFKACVAATSVILRSTLFYRRYVDSDRLFQTRPDLGAALLIRRSVTGTRGSGRQSFLPGKTMVVSASRQGGRELVPAGPAVGQS